MLHRLFVLSLLLSWLPTAQTQTTYTFKGGIFVSPWDNPATWTPNGVPGPLDTAVISILPGTNSALMFHDSFEVGTLRIRSYFDLLGSGKLTVLDSLYTSYPGYCFINLALAEGARGRVDDADYAGPGAFHVFNNVLAIDGDIVFDAAQVSVVEGRINGKVTVKQGRLLGHQIVNALGQLVIDPPVGDTLAIGRITNRGKVTWKNGHLRNLKRRFVNEGLWLMEASGHAMLNDSTHIDSLFVNDGLLVANSVSLYTHFVNSGTIAVVDSAVLTLEDGMHFYEGIFSGGTLRLRGDTSAVFGYVASNNMNVFDLDHTVLKVVDPFNPADTLRLNDAEVIGQGSLSVTGHFDWRGGTAHVPVHVFPDATAFVGSGALPPVAIDSFFNEGGVVQSGGFFPDGDCINAGTWTFADGLPACLAGNGTFQNSGSVLLCGDASGSLTFNLPATNQPSGRIEGDGTMTFGMGLNNLGLTAPGCTVGTLTIAHDFDTGAGVNIDVAGTQQGEFDRLVGFGDITAGGVLRIETPPGLIFTDTINIIHAAGAFLGTFDSVVAPPKYVVLYSPHGVDLTCLPTVHTVTDPLIQPWRLFPTLATDVVHLVANTIPDKNPHLLIRDATGRFMQVSKLDAGFQHLIIPVSNWPAGMYHVQILNGQETWNLKFWKIRG